MSAHPAGPIILALGDSLTAGYGLASHEAFPAQLERLIRSTMPDAYVINGGVSGNTSGQGIARLPRLLSSQRTKPDLAIVALGANDMIRGISAATMRSNLDAILSAFADCEIPVVLVGMLMPRFLGRERAEQYNRVFPELAAKHRSAFYPSFLKGVVGDPALTLWDRVHPNAKAVSIVARNIYPTVKSALERQMSSTGQAA